MNRRGLLLLLALLPLAACGRSPELDRLAAGETGVVEEVVSGHFVRLQDGREVRLVGIMAPKYEEPYAAEARAALERLAAGKAVRLYYGGRRTDAYGRALAHLRLKDGARWVQKEMLLAGAARVRMYPDNRALADAMLEAEATARNKQRGLWTLPDYTVLSPQKAAAEDGFVIVEGRPEAVDAGAGARLTFPGGFIAYAPARGLRPFEDAGRAPSTLRGKLLRLRGVVRDGEMRLDMPEQVEVLKSP